MTIKIVALLCLLSLTLQMSITECDIAGCSTCNQAHECQTCNEGFSLASNGQCTSDEKSAPRQYKVRTLQTDMSGNQTSGNYSNCTISGCDVCSNATACSACKTGFQITTNQTCMSCNVEQCTSCSRPDVCSTCWSGKFPSPNGGACFSCDRTLPNMNGCLSCNRNDECGLCQNGLQIITNQVGGNGICVKCDIQNCQRCGVESNDTSSTICRKCSLGYSSTPNRKLCIQCLFPCTTCTANPAPNNCATCMTPIFFATALENGTCMRNLIPGCIEPNQDNSSLCKTCTTGFNLVANGTRCAWECPLNCQVCSDNVTCTTCVNGFFLNPNQTCSQCKTRGCQVCSADGDTCNTCFKGFYLSNIECLACPGFCKDCSSSTTCNELAQSQNQVLLIVNGQSVLAVCESTCVTCSNISPQICLQCTDGHFLSEGRCRKCGGACRTCDSSNRTKCLSCYPNTFLSDDSCVRCNSTCMTCASSAQPSNCTSCWDGSYLVDSKCETGCPKNCFSCSNLTTCTQCLSGYTIFKRDNQVFCASCMTSCRTCAEGKPSTCLTCGRGFYLAGSFCVPCAPKCAECSAAGCTTCNPGYFMTSEQSCAPSCILPCATCSSSDPTSCLSCIAGYSFNDVTGTCDEVITCEGGCIVCPMGYSTNQGICLACTKQQCHSCNSNSLDECYSCKPGFFLTEEGVCQACSPQCRLCLSATGCLTCNSGFTSRENAVATSEGIECVKCVQPCLTCTGTPHNCDSCVQGFEKFGWKCGQTFRFAFGMKLQATLQDFEANYVTLIDQFAAALGVEDVNAITIDSIIIGSVDIEGSAAPTGPPGSAQAALQLQSLTNLLTSGNIAGMQAGLTSLTVPEGDVGQLAVEEEQDNVLAIVLGVCIPIGVLIIVGIIAFVVYKKKALEKVRDLDTEEQGNKNNFEATNDKIIH